MKSKSFHAARAALQETAPRRDLRGAAGDPLQDPGVDWSHDRPGGRGVYPAADGLDATEGPPDRRWRRGAPRAAGGPAEVDAESGPRISGAVFGRIWEIVCDAAPAEEKQGYNNMWFIWGKRGANGKRGAGRGACRNPHPSQTPVNHVDGWSWSHVVTEIRRWADIYPDPLPDPNDISEAEARRLLKTIYQHPVVIAEFERQRMVAEATQREYRDARTIQYAINVGVDLPDPTRRRWRRSSRALMTATGTASWRSIGTRSGIARRSTHGTSGTALIGSATRTCRMLALAKRVARTIHIEASATTDDRREKVGNGPSGRGCSHGSRR